MSRPDDPLLQPTPPTAKAPTAKAPSSAASTTKAIEQYIRTQGLTTGDPLPSESAICEQLGVSRSSVREAIRTLVSLDVLEVRHGTGTFVGKMSLAPLVNGLILRLTLNEELALVNLSHVVDTRVILDMAVADALAAQFHNQDVSHLEALVEQMRQKYETGQPFTEEDHNFHKALLKDLPNPLIRELSLAMWEIHNVTNPLLGVSPPEDMRTTVEAHEHMVQALQRGDAEEYKQLVHTHYEPLRRAIAAKIAHSPTEASGEQS
ncbi:FadR/GntR family transcriptional regulator [Corynebacterium kozikiae]|uniref:FadR/GntR family transcriptional regulator n=1 Tax=Corynebacterium kozikiae TaxID=2968469 RepID=UPI00211BD9FF|nr:FadR/GntR family transcriptional regulator [Corynebacterium sp. 76QC2CO]MCQ9342648.1 FadR family transcriptional regulator [Corynebacterium sp. 76QC2CO]